MTAHPLLPAEVQAEYRRLNLWEGITLAEVVAERAALHPDRPAIVGPEPLSYGQLWRHASKLAGYLVDAGMQPGEFLLAAQTNSWQGVVLAVAASIAGVALVPVSWRASPTLALNLFEQAGCRGVVIEAELLQAPQWREMFDVLRARVGDGVVLLVGRVAAEVEAYRSLPTLEHACATGREISQRAKDPTRVALVLSTGGSTGVPKGVMHCEDSLLYAGRSFGRCTDFSENDVYVAFGPYGHATGSVFDIYMPLVYGAAILPNARWKAPVVVDAIARYGGTYCITVGTHIFDLLALEQGVEPLLKSMRLVVSGAGPDHLFETAEQRFGFRVVRDYGLSECLGHAPGRPSDPAQVRLRKEGVPLPGLEFRITEPDSNKPMSLGEVGEYVCRGPSLFMGYLAQPELTRTSVTEDGFYRTGDLMMATADGYLTYVGRIKDVIRRGGLQIDILEMERLLSGHPKIAEVAVIGTPHPRLGEQAVMVVLPQTDQDRPRLEELVAYLIERGLPKECLPERLVFTTSLPRTEWGKFNRVAMRQWLAEQSEQQTRAAR